MDVQLNLVLRAVSPLSRKSKILKKHKNFIEKSEKNMFGRFFWTSIFDNQEQNLGRDNFTLFLSFLNFVPGFRKSKSPKFPQKLNFNFLNAFLWIFKNFDSLERGESTLKTKFISVYELCS